MKIIFDTQGKSSQLITIEGCDELENGYYILSHTATGNLQGIKLKSLDQGEGMFANTALSSDILAEIALWIKEYTDGSTHVIDLGNVSDSSIVRDKIEDIEGKGWTVTYNIGTYATCSSVDDVKAIERNYQTVDIDENGGWSEPLPSLEDGKEMFYMCSALTTFNSDLSSLTKGYSMFEDCSNLTTFTSDLSSLTNGHDMFRLCSSLTTFTSDSSGLPVSLSSLTNGGGMFANCINLSEFNSDLSSLIIGESMFGMCTNLTEFTSDLSSLTTGRWMFSSCTNLISFNSDLSSLWNGEYMFDGCINLTSFNADLSYLTNGYTMFRRCNLNTASIWNIAKTLQFVNVLTGNIDGRIHIGNIGEFTSDLIAACDLMTLKGWTVQYNEYVNYERSQNVSYLGEIVGALQSLLYYKKKNKITWRCEEIGVIKMYIDSELKDNSYVQSWLQSIKEKSWTVEEIYITSSDIIKYATCTTLDGVKAVDPDYLTNDIDENGVWSEPLPKLQDGRYQNSSLSSNTGMFENCDKLTSFNSDLSSLTDGHRMFYGCNNFTTFNSDLSSLIYGYQMFDSCEELTTFTSDLRSLKYGYWMFASCNNLTTFNCDALCYLTTAAEMFYNCNNLKSFNSSLSSLTDGHRMFYGCNNLTTFTSDLSSLTDGYQMFASCNNLTTFNSGLSSLKSGYLMFIGCELDAPSLQKIANTINDISKLNRDNNVDWTYYTLIDVQAEIVIEKSARGRIDIGYADDVLPSIVQYCGNTLIDKGWTVYFNNTLYEYATPFDVSEANGWCPDAYKNRDADSWNKVVLTPIMDVLKISIVNEEGEMLNDE